MWFSWGQTWSMRYQGGHKNSVFLFPSGSRAPYNGAWSSKSWLPALTLIPSSSSFCQCGPSGHESRRKPCRAINSYLGEGEECSSTFPTMLAAEGGFSGLMQRGKGTARKFTGIPGNACGEGAANAIGKLKWECRAPWESNEVGFPFEFFCRTLLRWATGTKGQRLRRIARIRINTKRC